MNDNEYTAAAVLEILGEGSPAVLATIITFTGSAPRHTGTKMVISADGRSYGTIGGGLLEATIIKESRNVIASRSSKLVEFSMLGKDANATEMICGGEALILLDYLPPEPEIRDIFQKWRETVREGKYFYYLTHFKRSDKGVDIQGHTILTADGRTFSTCKLTDAEIGAYREEARSVSATSLIRRDETDMVIDPIRRVKTVYCFGAGHVAVPTARIAAMAGFRVIVIDDRAEFANQKRFPEAYAVRVINDFNYALKDLEIDTSSFIIIITRGHQYDREVLEQSLKTEAGYIGMISSRRKRDTIYNALMEQGVTKEELARVHSPIGIPIGGETPEEIAVSIVAELIKVRAEQEA
jgi:xanthine dehydrogenase accessory factor